MVMGMPQQRYYIWLHSQAQNSKPCHKNISDEKYSIPNGNDKNLAPLVVEMK